MSSSPQNISVACLQFWVFSHNGDPWNWVQYFGCSFVLGGGEQSQLLIIWLQNLIHPSMFLVFNHCMGTLIHGQIFVHHDLLFVQLFLHLSCCKRYGSVLIFELCHEPLGQGTAVVMLLIYSYFYQQIIPLCPTPLKGEKNGHVSRWSIVHLSVLDCAAFNVVLTCLYKLKLW